MGFLGYLKLFGKSTSPPPQSWKVSEWYNTVFNFVSYTAERTKFFFGFEIPESIQYYCSGLYDSWDNSSTYAALLICITVLACTLATFYYTYQFSKYLRKAEKSLKVADKLITKGVGVQSKIEESVNIFSKFNEELNMADYLSEMRRQSKEKCPERPIEVEYTPLKLGPQKVISMNECLQNAHSTLEFINDTPLDVLGEPNTKKINSELLKPEEQKKGDYKNSSLQPSLKESEFERNYVMQPSTAIRNPKESLSNSSIHFRAQSVSRENLKARPKSRSVSTSTSCDRKTFRAIGNLKSLSNKSSITFRAQSVGRENLKARPKSRSVSKSTSCDRKPSTAIGNPKESLSNKPIPIRPQSVSRENLKARPKSRSVSKSSSCDRKNLPRWR